MSTLTYYEPHKLTAGALALVAHALFFSLLFFSFNWHVRTPPGMVAELWNSLPEPVAEVVPVPPPPPPLPVPVLQRAETISVPKVVEPVLAPKAEIEFKDKKKKKIAPVKKEPVKIAPVKKETPPVKSPPEPDEKSRQLEIEKQNALNLARQAKKQSLEKQLADDVQAARENELAQERRNKIRAEIDADTAKEVAKYKEMIQSKISRNIVMPPDVPDSAEAKFTVILLPGGSVMDGGVKLLKSSGNDAYDSAAERAIYKAQPLPVPTDPELARKFRELRLSVKP